MPTASIQINRRVVTDRCLAGTPVRADQYFLEFEIIVDKEGCYTVDVELLDHDATTGNDVIASMDGAVRPCFCFEANTGVRFHVGGAAGAAANSPVPSPSQGSNALPGLNGTWPQSDGPFDDELEVFAEIRLRVCRLGACDAAGKPCLPMPVRELGDLVGEWETFDDDVDVRNGTGVEEGIELLRDIGETAASAATMARADKPRPGREMALLAIAKRVRALERALALIKPRRQRIG